jgi:hypothetical protein
MGDIEVRRVDASSEDISAVFDRGARGDSAHFQLEPRLRGVTDSADGHTDHSPQDVAAD